uniref:Uncharacterized protein n=1 Tax=Medicago truncatula TaxID=3880 RepID=I3SCZ2_MEDTR|nr:unknown [Medicago truncatula]
MITLSNQSLIE